MASAAPYGFVRPSKAGALNRFRVSPGARRTVFMGLYGEDAVKLSVAVPPVDGKVNAEVERFLPGVLDVGRTDVAVVRGASSRDKTVLVRGVGAGELPGRLGPLP